MNLYLAGFDVFRTDAQAHGERLKAACAAHGITGWYPLDGDVPPGLSGPAAARWIFEANVARIRASDAVMANLNAFRGHEPDSGTAFEVGYAAALGKPIWAYTDEARPLVAQLGQGADAPGQPVHDTDGYLVEDFGLPVNLMLACAARLVVGDAQACLAAIAASRQRAAGAGTPAPGAGAAGLDTV
ncbi:nucleoside 2-deoxyribosyltransferase [Achromobacter sp. GG226]|uniref:nucleoside 2-deoxyribosyltransferase n=1 Tax=Verticiella alkaliphila TaxID=2779529 RepID=UPI001C0CC7CD|nr:nucleoside 2-deoxyribosyltransferase [Verticiella sp. GG226]MBU4610068.1 nucleoside 2-deoxyribosyltransferase [Verticiella sp. GG226]